MLVATLLFALAGFRAFRSLPIEAFPDVTDPMVEIVGLYPGQSAEEVEKRVTIELERVLAGTPHLVDLRSVSVFGLSLVTLTFDENTTDFELRTLVGERLRDAALPEGASTVMGPQATPVGQIYRYTLEGNRTLRDLRSPRWTGTARDSRASDRVLGRRVSDRTGRRISSRSGRLADTATAVSPVRAAI